MRYGEPAGCGLFGRYLNTVGGFPSLFQFLIEHSQCNLALMHGNDKLQFLQFKVEIVKHRVSYLFLLITSQQA